MMTLYKLASCLVLAMTHLLALASGIELTVSKTGGNASSPLLYGLMFEVRGIIEVRTALVSCLMLFRILTTQV